MDGAIQAIGQQDSIDPNDPMPWYHNLQLYRPNFQSARLVLKILN
jgi:hypothetical protein